MMKHGSLELATRGAISGRDSARNPHPTHGPLSWCDPAIAVAYFLAAQLSFTLS
jgi:hypothetical protein